MKTSMEIDDFIVNCKLSFQRSLLLGTFRFLDEDEDEFEILAKILRKFTARTINFTHF